MGILSRAVDFVLGPVEDHPHGQRSVAAEQIYASRGSYAAATAAGRQQADRVERERAAGGSSSGNRRDELWYSFGPDLQQSLTLSESTERAAHWQRLQKERAGDLSRLDQPSSPALLVTFPPLQPKLHDPITNALPAPFADPLRAAPEAIRGGGSFTPPASPESEPEPARHGSEGAGRERRDTMPVPEDPIGPAGKRRWGDRIQNLEWELRELRTSARKQRADDSAKIEQLGKALERKTRSEGQMIVKLRTALHESEADSKTSQRRLVLAEARLEESGRIIGELEAELTEAKETQIDASKSLSELRSFLSIDDAGDTSRVIQGIKDINQAVDDFSYLLVTALPDDVRATPISSMFANILLARQQQGWAGVALFSQHLKRAMDLGSPPTGDDYLLPLIQLIVNELLATNVLSQFHTSISKEQSQFLATLNGALRQSGNQQQAARWRSMTSRALSEAAEAKHVTSYARDAAKWLVCDLAELLCDAGLPIDDAMLHKWHAELVPLVLDTIKWQRLHREEYMSSDFDLFFPSFAITTPDGTQPPSFDPASMVDDSCAKGAQGPQAGSSVIAALSFGLRQTRLKVESDGVRRSESEVLVKATVLTSSWLSHV